MSTHKRIDMICIVSIILSVVVTAFLAHGKGSEAAAAMSGEADSNISTVNDPDADWDTASATKIALSDEGSRIDGSGAYIYEGDVCIAYGGYYVLTGELTNGSVIVDADKSDGVWILLDGVTIHSDDDAAIRVEQADKVFLTLADGTENRISSGEQYGEEAVNTGVDGAIYSRDDLTINGTGNLVVDAAYEHGIVCNDDLVINGGDITISAVQDGIHANDSVRIRNAAVSISAGDDGITVSNDDETASIYVESGNIVISDCYEGLEAVDITIAGGKVDIMSTDDGINASGSGENSVIRITGGDVRIVNSTGRDADGLDSNGSIYVEGGKVFISVSDSGSNCAIDCGSENGGECIISGGTVIACGGSAMAEGFDAASPQGFLMYNTSAQAGTAISLENADGKEILSEEIPCSFSSALLSAPELAVGDVCKITVGEEQEQLTIDNVQASGFAPAGMFGGMRGGRQSDGMPGPSDPADKKDMRPSGDAASFEKGELPDRMDVPDGENFSGRMVSPDGEGNPGRMKAPDDESRSDRMASPDNGNFSDRRAMREDISASSISADTLTLTGISVLVLLIGLLVAVKIKH